MRAHELCGPPVLSSLASSGLANQCPNNVCEGFNPQTGVYQQFVALASHAAGYFKFSNVPYLYDGIHPPGETKARDCSRCSTTSTTYYDDKNFYTRDSASGVYIKTGSYQVDAAQFGDGMTISTFTVVSRDRSSADVWVSEAFPAFPYMLSFPVQMAPPPGQTDVPWLRRTNSPTSPLFPYYGDSPIPTGFCKYGTPGC